MYDLQQLIPLLIPLVLIQLTLQVIALVNLSKKEQVRFNNKLIWVLIIVFGNMIGAIMYFIFGGVQDDGSRID